MTRIGRPVLMATALALVVAACGGGTTATTTTAPTTTTTTAPTTTTTTVPETTTTTTTLPATPVMATEGDSNDTVATIQFLIVCAGYADLTPDGNFGLGTTTAVQAAQTALGFEATGVVHEDFFAVLTRACPEERPITPSAEGVSVVGYTAPGDPEVFSISLLFGSTLSIVPGEGVIVFVKDGTGTALASEDGITFSILNTDEYTIEVSTEGEPTVYTLDVTVDPGAGVGDWIITTDGITYKGTKFALGDPAGPMITKIFEFLGHNVRSNFDEFDTGWHAPGQDGFRGIMIEGMAFLFYGPNAGNPARPEVFGRVRYLGPSFDKDGNPRPAGYVQTLSGITVGNTLAELKTTYGGGVQPGSNADEHYYRYGSADGKEVCFYFGEDAPTDATKIIEISTECRG